MDRYWTVDSRGGDEQLWVIATESPIDAGNLPERLRHTMLDLETTEHDSAARPPAGPFVYKEATLEHGETAWVGLIELRGEP
jgi:hypothetical protein